MSDYTDDPSDTGNPFGLEAMRERYTPSLRARLATSGSMMGLALKHDPAPAARLLRAMDRAISLITPAQKDKAA